jgi:hypothetical protein
MSISVRNSKPVRTVDHHIEKIPKLKKSSSAPNLHHKLEAEIPKNIKFRPDERQNFKIKMLQKAASNNGRNAP